MEKLRRKVNNQLRIEEDIGKEIKKE